MATAKKGSERRICWALFSLPNEDACGEIASISDCRMLCVHCLKVNCGAHVHRNEIVCHIVKSNDSIEKWRMDFNHLCSKGIISTRCSLHLITVSPINSL